MDLIKAATENIMAHKIEWPDASALEADQFADMAIPMIKERFDHLTEIDAYVVAVKIWRHLREE